MLQVDELGWNPCCSGGVEPGHIAPSVVSPSPAFHCIPAHAVPVRLAVAARAALPGRPDGRAPDRKQSRGVGYSSRHE
jgi:hypothetical protein